MELEHTYVGDLTVTLESPTGTVVTLLDRPGVPASANGCDNDDMNVTFDDASGFDPESHCTGSTPWYADRVPPLPPAGSKPKVSILRSFVTR